MRVRTLVVGGGVMGTSIAMQVARRSDPLTEPVLLLERTQLAAGSSGRSGAILRQHYTDRELAGMARDSLREYAGFETRTGYPVGFRACGVLTLAGAADESAQELVRGNVEMQRSIGIDTRIVEAEEIRSIAPGIDVEAGVVGAYEPGAGVCDPHVTVESFATLARFYGATTRSGVEVLELLVEGGRVRGVRTPDGRIEAERVVLAAGPWSGRLLAAAGVDLPLRVLRPEQHFVTMPETPVVRETAPQGEASEDEARFLEPREEHTHAHPVVLDLEQGSYARCEPTAGRSRVGRMDYANAERLEDPDDLSEAVSEPFQRWARGALIRRLPPYEALPDAGAQAGWYTVTPDAQPLLGPWPGIEGLFLVAGFSGHGFKLAPSVGLGLTQMLFEEPVSAFAPEFFSPTRFGDGPVEWGGEFGL